MEDLEEDLISIPEDGKGFGRQSTGDPLANSKFAAISNELREILDEAKALGASRLASREKRRQLTIIYNPVSGNGTAKKIIDRLVTPVFRAALVEFDVVPTQYAGFAMEYVEELDISKLDGLMIAGGDGLVHEVVTGYCR